MAKSKKEKPGLQQMVNRKGSRCPPGFQYRKYFKKCVSKCPAGKVIRHRKIKAPICITKSK